MKNNFFEKIKNTYMKNKAGFIGITAAVIAVVVVLAVVIGINMSKNNKDAVSVASGASDENSKENTESSDASEAGGDETDCKVYVKIDMSNSWESQGIKFGQFDIAVENQNDNDITGWKLNVDAAEVDRIDQFWNCDAALNDGKIKIEPKDYAVQVKAHDEVKGIGVILAFNDDYKPDNYELEFTLSDGTTKKVSSADISENNAENNTENSTENNAAADNGKGQKPNDSNTGNASEPDKNNTKTDGGQQSSAAVTQFPLQKLHVDGTKIVNEQGQQVQLKGVSTHGLAWYPDYVNQDAFATLKNDWHANCVRLAMYTAEYGGYCTGGDKQHLKQLIDNGVNYATAQGLYVIIDWHILSDSNPNTYKSEAISFFDEISKKYSGHNNVIYEVCNEPSNTSWSSQIKPYAQDVVNTIRNNDRDAIIIVGTNTWSQDVDDVIGNRIDDPNVMYALHFYAGTHKDAIRNKLKKALNNGIPVFVSECSICDASGNGGIDYNSANQWLELLNSNSVSFVCWSLSNKNETSALINPGCSKLSGWSDSDLSETGKWFKKAISQ